ncbi:Rho guanine nucleotide exchange factor (GEF) 15 [Blomia tropicalis]|nr:Rho guanine nucleotide exchange factor (GEF) 15 [Blomia tropicalis]
MLNYLILVVVILSLVSTYILKFIRNDGLSSSSSINGEDDHRDNDLFDENNSPLSRSRESSRRKAVYRRNSQLNEYLERNLSKGGNNDNVQFQSNFPWKTYVQNSRHGNKIQDLDSTELKMFESLFEIILTEKSYLSQLDRLTSFDELHPEMEEVFSRYNKNLLFGNIHQLYTINQQLYHSFETAFHSDVFMSQLLTILSEYFTNGSFEPYIDYIKGHEERNLLLSDESKCQIVPDLIQLRSLIIVPMQRITRYPLLVQNVLRISEKCSSSKQPNRKIIEKCYQNASCFATKCNKALDDERKLFDLIELKKQLIGDQIGDLVSPNRSIVLKIMVKLFENKTGTISTPILSSKSGSSVFKSYSSSLTNKPKSILILLSDMLILAEYKSKKNQYLVINHDRLDQVQFENANSVRDGSNESIEKLSDDSLKTRRILTLRSSDCTYGVIFTSIDDENKFASQLQKLTLNSL